MDAFFTSNPRRQTDRRIPGRTWAGVSGQPAPSRICRICTAEHRPVSVCRIQRKTFLCSPHRSYTSSRLPAIPAFWCRIPGRIFRLPSRRTADISSFRRQALVPAFYCHSSGRIFSSILQQLPEPEQAALLAAVRPSDRDSARSCRPPDLPCSCP